MKEKDFKGIYYKNKKPIKYYEGGAHFKYSDLVDALTKLENSKNNKIHSLQKNSKIKNETHRLKIFGGKKINTNLLTLNKNKDIYHYREHLSTDKYLNRKEREREKERKKRIMELINFNVKVSPFKNSLIMNKKYYCNNSLNNNYKTKLKKSFGESSNNKTQIVKDTYLKTQANQEKKDNYELPIIKSIYNFNNKSLEKMKMRSNKTKLDLKFIPRSKLAFNKTKNSKENLFHNNKLFSLNRDKYFGNNEIGKDGFFETFKNSKNYETIEIYAKKSEYNFDKKIIKHLFSKKSSLRLTNNFKIIH
jgi:hypothetical protein